MAENDLSTDRNKNQTWNLADAACAYAKDNVYRVRVIFPDMWQELEKLNAQAPIETVMDYGCGSGLFFETCPSSLQEVQFTGYDISPPMLKIAGETAERLSHLQVEITNNLDAVPTGTFDAVTCIAVWPNWSSHNMCMENLKMIRRLLRSSGKALFAVTNPQWVEHDPEYLFHLPPEHRNTAGFKFEITRRGNLHPNIPPTINYVWPLSIVRDQLLEAGFNGRIFIDEYPPEHGAPHSSWAKIIASP